MFFLFSLFYVCYWSHWWYILKGHISQISSRLRAGFRIYIEKIYILINLSQTLSLPIITALNHMLLFSLLSLILTSSVLAQHQEMCGHMTPTERPRDTCGSCVPFEGNSVTAQSHCPQRRDWSRLPWRHVIHDQSYASCFHYSFSIFWPILLFILTRG